MPKINAATLAEHRQQRLTALLDATRDLLLAEGAEAVTFASVAERAGLARNSVYEYFSSRSGLLLALAEREMPAWIAVTEKAVARAKTPDAAVKAYITSQLTRVGDGQHEIAAALSSVRFDAAGAERLGRLHAQMAGSLVGAMRDLGQPRPALAAQLVHGIVLSAARLIVAGQPAATVQRDAVRIALQGVATDA